MNWLTRAFQILVFVLFCIGGGLAIVSMWLLYAVVAMLAYVGRQLARLFPAPVAILLLAIALSASGDRSQRLATDDDDPELLMQCPAACRQIEYDSFWWYVECWGLPRKCSANPTGLAPRRTRTLRDVRFR